MERLIERIYKWLLASLQRRCQHPAEDVTADIREGDDRGVAVQWCRICGAYQVVYYTHQTGGIGGFVLPFAQAGGLLGSLFGNRPNVKTQLPSRSLLVNLGGINASNPEFPIHTGWRTPDPHWRANAIPFDDGAEPTEGTAQ